VASEVGGGAAEPAELAFAPAADHDQTGLIGCRVLEESDARVAMGDDDGVFHAEVAEWFQRLFGVGSDAVLDLFRVPGGLSQPGPIHRAIVAGTPRSAQNLADHDRTRSATAEQSAPTRTRVSSGGSSVDRRGTTTRGRWVVKRRVG